MSDIFLSYAKEDKERAKALAEALQSCGWSVWWDAEIPPGQTWDDMIEEELATAKCIVVLWSRQSVGKHWVRTEAALAFERGVLVPVLIESVLPPLAFRRVQAAPLFDWNRQREHEGFKHLLQAVERLVSAPQPAQSRCRQETSWPAAEMVSAGVEAGSPRTEAAAPKRDEHSVPVAPYLEAPVLAPVVAAMTGKQAAAAPGKKRRAIAASVLLICLAGLGYIFREAIILAFPSLEPAGSTLAKPAVSPAPLRAMNPEPGALGQTSSGAPEQERTAGPPNFAADTSPAGTGAPTPTTAAAVQTPPIAPAAAAAFPVEAAPVVPLPNFESQAKAPKPKKMQQQYKTSTAPQKTKSYESTDKPLTAQKEVQPPTAQKEIQPPIAQKEAQPKSSGSGWKIIRD